MNTKFLGALLALLLTAPALAAIKETPVTYKDGDTTLRGFVVVDTASMERFISSADVAVCWTAAATEMLEAVTCSMDADISFTDDASSSPEVVTDWAWSAVRRSDCAISVVAVCTESTSRSCASVICATDPAGHFVTVSAACEALWGYKPEELIGKNYSEIVHRDDQEKSWLANLEIMSGHSVTNFENRCVRRDGPCQS